MSIVPAVQEGGEKFRATDPEICAIGCMLLSDKACQKVALAVSERMFFSPAHQMVFSACMDIHKTTGCAPDLVTLKSRLETAGNLQKVGGTDYLIQIMESVPAAANAKAYALIVRDAWRRREIRDRASKIAKSAQSGDELNELFKLIQGFGQGLSDETSDTFKLSEILLADDAAQGVTSGFKSIDASNTAGGFSIGDPHMVMAPTGIGKTAIATQCMMAAAEAGYKVAFATYEMGGEAIKRRMMKQKSGFYSRPKDLTLCHLWDDWLEKINDPFDVYDNITIFDPSGRDSLDNTIEDLVNWTMVQKDGQGLDALFVDYIQLIRTAKGSLKKFEDGEAVADRIKKLARRADIPIVFLSQQNDDGRAKLTRTFEDIVSVWIRIEKDQSHLHLDKNRHGQKCSIPVRFNKLHLTYEEI